MGRGKKKEENLTLEEKLEQALVLKEEWPYEVPGNWCWVKLSDLCDDIRAGGDKPKNITAVKTYENKVPVVANGIIDDGIIGYTDCEKENSNTITVSGRGTIGYSIFRDYSYFPVVRVIVISPKENVVGLYIKYAFDNFKEAGTGTSIPQLTVPMILNKSIPLPPLSEQQQIIYYIQRLFAKLDEAKEKVQFVLENSENRKAAILHKAFSGKLTEQWRREQGIEWDSWKIQKMSSLGKLERGKSKHRPRNDPSLFGDKYPFIQTGDVSEANVYIKKHKQSLSELGLKQSRLFPAGTLCITIAANIGNVAILSYDSCFPDSVVGFTPYDEIDSKYIYYAMCTMQKKLEAEAPATAQKNINLKVLNDITLNVPLFSEQHEIVKILNELLEKENRIEIICDNIFTQIDLLKKSILSRAFRGELGTNNPDEESAIELLKTIL